MPEHNHIRFVQIGGPRQPYYAVAHHLWGINADFDSDGDSDTPDSSDWTELTLANRRDPQERIDIDPIQTDPLVLKVVGTKKELTARAAQYLAETTGGSVVSPPPGGV